MSENSSVLYGPVLYEYILWTRTWGVQILNFKRFFFYSMSYNAQNTEKLFYWEGFTSGVKKKKYQLVKTIR